MSNQKWGAKINVRFVSANPLTRLLVTIWAIAEFFFGIRRKGDLAEYEGHLEITLTNYILWFWQTNQTTTIVQKRNISGYSVGYTKQWIFWRCVVGRLYATGGVVEDEMVFQKITYPDLKEKFQEMF